MTDSQVKHKYKVLDEETKVLLRDFAKLFGCSEGKELFTYLRENPEKTVFDAADETEFNHSGIALKIKSKGEAELIEKAAENDLDEDNPFFSDDLGSRSMQILYLKEPSVTNEELAGDTDVSQGYVREIARKLRSKDYLTGEENNEVITDFYTEKGAELYKFLDKVKEIYESPNESVENNRENGSKPENKDYSDWRESFFGQDSFHTDSIDDFVEKVNSESEDYFLTRFTERSGYTWFKDISPPRVSETDPSQIGSKYVVVEPDGSGGPGGMNSAKIKEEISSEQILRLLN